MHLDVLTPRQVGILERLKTAPTVAQFLKLEAIAGRGSRKVFVDLRLICRNGLRLEDVFTLAERKYGTVRTDRYHRLRALAFFDDAEQQPMPDMLVRHDWTETRAFFTAEAKRLLAAGLASA